MMNSHCGQEIPTLSSDRKSRWQKQPEDAIKQKREKKIGQSVVY